MAVLDFEQVLGKAVGTSPWHVVSPALYSETGAVTVWGATLTDVYRFVVDGPRFEALDLFAVNDLPTSIPWNLILRDDGRVIVPDQSGYRSGPLGGPCATTDPSLLVLRDDGVDGGSVQGASRCEKSLELTASALRSACGITGGIYQRALSATFLAPTFSGEIATVVVFEDAGVQSSYLTIVDASLDGVVACAFIDDSSATNEIPSEPLGAGVTGFYVATGDALVKMTYDSRARAVGRSWERALALRERTGTTPTLVDTSSGERFAVLVDGQCATSNVLNGLITCSDDTSPSKLIAVRREDDTGGAPVVVTTDLPAWLTTVENSPAARGDFVVVANYSGYLPNGLRVPPGGQKPAGGAGTWGVSPDAVADFATGIVALRYSPSIAAFEIVWSDAATQLSGVPTISGASNMVYGTGAEEETGKLYLYGFRLAEDATGPAGQRLIRAEVASAPFRQATVDLNGNTIFARADYSLLSGELYDAGNNLLVLDDGSLLFTGGSALVRVVEH